MPNPDVPAGVADRADYDEEGRKLIASFGLTPAAGRYNDLDPIWRDERTGGVIYVGNERAARGPAARLREKGITHVVNCTDDMNNFCEARAGGDGAEPLTYLRWNVAYWQDAGVRRSERPATAAQIVAFVRTLLDFVDAALADGGGVLVHCLAGAHRAGTTGCLLLMYKQQLSAAKAVMAAKQLRPVINPIGSLPRLLQLFEGHGVHNVRGAQGALPGAT
jgi:predicted protein tyrosine phosphatase